jgi:hypothetical protein
MKRLKKILKWTGIILLGLVAIGLIANAAFVWITDTRLERQLAAIRAAGDPLTLADLARPAVPPEDNAATYLRRAEADIAAIAKEMRHAHYASQCPGFILSPEDQKTIKAALAAYPNAFPLLERAAACPDWNAELDYTLPTDDFMKEFLVLTNKSRAAAMILRYRADLLVAEGNCDDAVRTALLTFRLARHFDRNPLLVGYLVALAVRGMAIESANEALQTGPVSKEVREALDAELAIQERMDGSPAALKSERAFMLQYSQSKGAIPNRDLWFVGRGVANTWESDCLDLFPSCIAMAGAGASYREVQQVLAIKQSPMARALCSSLEPAFRSVARTRARIRSLRVLDALQARVPAESNEPPKLSELHLPAETTVDPFNGEPLHVKKTPQGWLVYSVGPNLRDDGGILEDYRDGDVGVGPPPVAEPAHRGQEKKPAK